MPNNIVYPSTMTVHLEEHEFDKVSFILVEVLRWVTICVPLYLSTWRWAEIRGYPEFVSSSFPNVTEEGTFLTVSALGILGCSLCLYLPTKMIITRYKWKNKLFSDSRWRPSILAYILLCALPSMTMILEALSNPKDDSATTMDNATITVLQLIVFGLVLTEWISKFREEYFSYDLVTAMAVDFFVAYDIIAFFMMSTLNPHLFRSNWIYVDFVFSLIAMFKYIPNCPVQMDRKGSAKGTMVVILVSMLVNDIPFVIIRCTTLALFDGRTSDIIYPLKNAAMVIFGTIQMVVIYKNIKSHEQTGDIAVRVYRKTKFPGAWDRGPELDPCECMNTITKADEKEKRESMMAANLPQRIEIHEIPGNDERAIVEQEKELQD